jgi:hypothetical protein
MASNTEFRTDNGFVEGLLVAANALLPSFFNRMRDARMATLYARYEVTISFDSFRISAFVQGRATVTLVFVTK